jgi:hypothetical protein
MPCAEQATTSALKDTGQRFPNPVCTSPLIAPESPAWVRSSSKTIGCSPGASGAFTSMVTCTPSSRIAYLKEASLGLW